MANTPQQPLQAPPSLIATLLLAQPRDQLEALIEAAIAAIDMIDGDADLESEGLEDDFDISHQQLEVAQDGPGCRISDPDYGVDDQGEDIDEREVDDEDGSVLSYGIDQTRGFTDGIDSDRRAMKEQLRRIHRTRCYPQIQRIRGYPDRIQHYLLSNEPIIPARRHLLKRKRGVPKRPRP